MTAQTNYCRLRRGEDMPVTATVLSTKTMSNACERNLLRCDFLLRVLMLCIVLIVMGAEGWANTVRYSGTVILAEPDARGGIKETSTGLIIQHDQESGVSYIQQDLTAFYGSKVELYCNGVDIFIRERFQKTNAKQLVTVRNVGTHILGETIGTLVEIPYIITCTKYWEITNRTACEVPISILHKNPDFGCDTFTIKPGNAEGEVLFWLNGTGQTKKDRYEYQLPPPYHNGYVAARLTVHRDMVPTPGTLPKQVDFAVYRMKPGAVNADDVDLDYRLSVIITNVDMAPERLAAVPPAPKDDTLDVVDYRFTPLHGNPFFYRVGKAGDFKQFVESRSTEFARIENALAGRLGIAPKKQTPMMRYVVVAVLFVIFASFVLVLIKEAKKTSTT